MASSQTLKAECLTLRERVRDVRNLIERRKKFPPAVGNVIEGILDDLEAARDLVCPPPPIELEPEATTLDREFARTVQKVLIGAIGSRGFIEWAESEGHVDGRWPACVEQMLEAIRDEAERALRTVRLATARDIIQRRLN